MRLIPAVERLLPGEHCRRFTFTRISGYTEGVLRLAGYRLMLAVERR